ncbi:Aspartate racemase [bioreactor metagenome]|uniref:Aspartate racemase n=1 Tax=bioreactor metagenome TaxID=1076179 RepID=A0A645DEF9_9ZZZZ
MASTYFSELLISLADVARDQDHLDTIMVNRPSTPDRTAYILGKSSENPVPVIIGAGKTLKAAGVEAIAIPCVTSHYFYDQICEGIGLPVISMLECVADRLKSSGINRAGIMATTGTVTTGLFQKALARRGIECVVPSEKSQQRVMYVIYDCIKAGKPADMPAFFSVCEELFEAGAGSVILGCTELSVANKSIGLGGRYTDSLEELARSCLIRFGIKTKNRAFD